MNVKLLGSIVALALLAACGGGGGSGIATYSAVKVFSNGDGVGRGVANDGTKLVFIAPDLAATIISANSATADSIINVQPSEFPVVQRLSSNANLRQGAVVVEGLASNVTIVEDDGGDASLILFDIPNVASLGMAGGSALAGNPSGSHTYNGTMSMGRRSSGAAGQQLGAFAMSANFNTETYSFVGATESHSLIGNGLIDIASGRFSSNSLDATTFGTSRDATMYGELHGNSANSVSGIFHTNESSATYSGGFVGTK